MRVLVTGASGFLGSHVAEAFAGAGHEVRTLLRKTSSRKYLTFPREEAIGDVTDIESLGTAVAGMDAIVHAAGLIAARNEAEFASVNEAGTANLLSAIDRHNPDVKRLIYISSLAAHGPGGDGQPRPVDAPPQPLTAYGRTKLAGERLVRGSRIAHRAVTFRPPAIYGPRDPALLPFFKLARWRFAPLLNGGHNLASMIYGPDCAQAVLLAATAEANIGGRVYCPEDGTPHTWRDMMSAIEAASGRRMYGIPTPHLAYQVAALASEALGVIRRRAVVFNREKVLEMSQDAWVCDSTELRRDVGWVPTVDIREGARRTYEWYQRERWL